MLTTALLITTDVMSEFPRNALDPTVSTVSGRTRAPLSLQPLQNDVEMSVVELSKVTMSNDVP